MPVANKRVTAFTVAIARAMRIPQDEIRVIARGAYLYDVDYEAVRKIPDLKEAAKIVLSHKEHWDGRGGPRGLRGDQIPIGARIFAVAHTLERITSAQTDRPAQSLQEAREEIQRGSARQFDPWVVRAFMSMPEQLWEDLQKAIREYPGP